MERSIARQASPRKANPRQASPDKRVPDKRVLLGVSRMTHRASFFSRIKPFLSATVRRSLPVKRIARDERPSCVRPLLTQRGKRRLGPGSVPGSRVSSVQGSRQHMLRDQE